MNLVEKIKAEIERRLDLSDSASEQTHQYTMMIAKATLRAIDEAGWQVVPVEADEGMVLAGRDALATCDEPYVADCIKAIHRAMIAAAPDVEENCND